MKPLYPLIIYIATLTSMAGACTQPFTQGKRLYEANCSRCHGMDGQGFEDLYPGISHSAYVTGNRPELACVIAYGSTYLNQGNNGDIEMPENPHLSPVEILNIMNFISWEFGEQQPHTIENTMQTLEACEP